MQSASQCMVGLCRQLQRDRVNRVFRNLGEAGRVRGHLRERWREPHLDILEIGGAFEVGFGQARSEQRLVNVRLRGEPLNAVSLARITGVGWAPGVGWVPGAGWVPGISWFPRVGWFPG